MSGLLYKQLLARVFVLHDPAERVRIYRDWIGGRAAHSPLYPPLWPPHLLGEHTTEERSVATPGSGRFVRYHGERPAFRADIRQVEEHFERLGAPDAVSAARKTSGSEAQDKTQLVCAVSPVPVPDRRRTERPDQKVPHKARDG